MPRQQVGAVSRKTANNFLAALVLLLGVFSLACAPQAVAQGRVVAVGDIHGDYDAFAGILQRAGLMDAELRWAGGNATLVQTGDFLDRGPKERQVMELLMELERRAPLAGGRVITLLGNHEVMNILGDLRYVPQNGYAEFADQNSERKRQAALRLWVDWQKRRPRAKSRPAAAATPNAETEWMKSHPLGFIEHREAYGPQGKYGKWLRQKSAVARVGDTVFLHGGIHPQFATWKLDDLNTRIQSELKAFDSFKDYLVNRGVILPFFTLEEIMNAVQGELALKKAALSQPSPYPAGSIDATEAQDSALRHIARLEQFLGFGNWLCVHPIGPLWYRGFADWNDAEGAELSAKILKSFGATHFVVGHSTQAAGRIRPRFDAKVFLIDTGMLSSYYPGGRASALEIHEGNFTAIYEDQRAVLLQAPGTRSHAVGQDFDQEAYGGGSVEEPRWEAERQEPAAQSNAPARVWFDANKQPLPFKSDEEILEYLRTAKPGKTRGTSKGIMGVRRVELEKDGIKVRAAFRDMREEKDRAELAGGQRVMFFRDDYIFECAAYEVARMLGLDNVPPTAERSLYGKKGSIQIWIENTLMDEGERQKNKVTPPDVFAWNRQVQVMKVFDNLIYNFDRNVANIIIDENWKLWMIDHSRSFRRDPDLMSAPGINQCERGLWEHLKNFNEADAKQRLKPFLRPAEIDALLKRRVKLVDYIQKLIDQKGENEVLFSWGASVKKPE